MRPRLPRRPSLPSVLACLVLAACAGGGAGREADGWQELEPEAGGAGPALHLNGTVRYLELEGGLFVIEEADGTRYNPINLPKAYQVDRMAVEADARRRDDVASIGMVGPMVELLRIRKVPSESSHPPARDSA